MTPIASLPATVAEVAAAAVSLATEGEEVSASNNASVSPDWQTVGTNVSPVIRAYRIIIPVICAIGLLGNAFNLALLVRKRKGSCLDAVGRSASNTMISLATSDILFCLAVLPQTLVATYDYCVAAPARYMLYYRVYGTAFINLFFMTSSHLVTVTAYMRNVAVTSPLRAKSSWILRNSHVTVIGTCCFCVILTLPHFTYLAVDISDADLPASVYCIVYLFDGRLELWNQSYIAWAWPLFASLMPCVVLLACNLALIHRLRLASETRRSAAPLSPPSSSSSRHLTCTLLSICISHLLLVTPAELFKYVIPAFGWDCFEAQSVVPIANVMQTCNFALNFLFYIITNATFRSTLRNLTTSDMCWHKHRSLLRVTSQLTGSLYYQSTVTLHSWPSLSARTTSLTTIEHVTPRRKAVNSGIKWAYLVGAELIFPRRSLTQSDSTASKTTPSIARVQTGVNVTTTQVVL